VWGRRESVVPQPVAWDFFLIESATSTSLAAFQSRPEVI
jgi:hypothetical protein